MMNINFKHNILIGKFVLLCLLISSCANNESNFAEFPKGSKPLVTATTTSFTVIEGETVVIPLNLEYVIDKAIDLQILVTGGTATIFEDYEVGDSAIPDENGIPTSGFIARFSPFSESLEIPFSAIMDMLPEDTETVSLNIAATGIRSALTEEGGIDIVVNIENFTSDELGAILSWGSDVTYSFVNDDGETEKITESLCDIADFDVLSDPEVPIGDYVLGSSDCPEITYEAGVLSDGSYDIYTDLYDIDPSETPSQEFNVPIELTIAKVGKFIATITYDDLYTSNSETSFPAGANDGLQLAATIVVSNGKYTVYDKDGNLIATE